MNDDTVLQHVLRCAGAAADKRGENLLILQIGAMSSLADYFLIVSGSSDRRVQTIAEAVIQTMKEVGVRPLGVEGMREGRWVLVDFGAWVVHVFYEEARHLFDLEEFWFDAPRVEIPEEILNPRAEGGGGN